MARKTSRASIWATALVLFFAAATGVRAQVIVNGSFESGQVNIGDGYQVNAPNKRPRYAGRAAAAATATGLMSKHLAQLKALLDEALN